MLSKKEALCRLEDIAHQLGAVDTIGGIRELYGKHQICDLDELAKHMMVHEFGLREVQWLHTEWDWLDLEWRGAFDAYFKAIIPDFNDEQPVYIIVFGYYSDSDPEYDYIVPCTIYTEQEWVDVRQKAIEEMQNDIHLATYLTMYRHSSCHFS